MKLMSVRFADIGRGIAGPGPHLGVSRSWLSRSASANCRATWVTAEYGDCESGGTFASTPPCPLSCAATRRVGPRSPALLPEDTHQSRRCSCFFGGTFVGIEHLRQRGWPRALYKEAMRKQYHFRKSQKGFYAWDVDRLLDLSRDIEIIDVPLTEIAELDEDYWFAGSAESPTCRKVVEHCDLINKADLSYPIVLCSEGRVMDGMHRIAKALLVERRTIKAVKFSATPEPDYVDVLPHELTY